VMLAVLLTLGSWQVVRLHWKQDLLSQIARAEIAPAVPLPKNPDPFTKVQVSGHLREDLSATYGAEVRDTPAGTQLGSQLIVALERNVGDPILVDRGWVPDKRSAPLAQTEDDTKASPTTTRRFRARHALPMPPPHHRARAARRTFRLSRRRLASTHAPARPALTRVKHS